MKACIFFLSLLCLSCVTTYGYELNPVTKEQIRISDTGFYVICQGEIYRPYALMYLGKGLYQPIFNDWDVE